ncbi:unnamed protein product [Pleuronectes platessa]|uniref:CWH43-like N-terminal domain-containing protein n=1 Tax=Pleuronectes platessa TaxID=8262 RepID=A0A9N7U863_PLEPL|nr:unnamed protein product [Pleuronectes platessa]
MRISDVMLKRNYTVGDTMWNCSPWALLPPVYSLFTAAGLWVVYFVAVNDEQIFPLSSQGSVAGNFPPASCIFSEVMNLAAFVARCSLPELSTGRLIHELGTSLTFGLGTLFCWVQSCITLKVDFRNEGRKVAISRFLLSGAATVSMFIRLLLMMDDLQGVRCQWALVMFFLAFISTFAIEFRHSRFGMVCTDNIQTHSERYRNELDQL